MSQAYGHLKCVECTQAICHNPVPRVKWIIFQLFVFFELYVVPPKLMKTASSGNDARDQ